jgi:hypothetical protein
MIRDNSAYLISEIKKATEEKIATLKAEHKQHLARLNKEYKESKAVELRQLELSLEKQRKDYVLQQENMMRLRQEHEKLAAQSSVVKDIQEEVKNEMLKASMLKAIIASLGDVTELEVPAATKMAGAKTRQDNKIVGTLASGAQREFDIDEFLQEQKGIIYAKVRELL